jgi:hypothetical protein
MWQYKLPHEKQKPGFHSQHHSHSIPCIPPMIAVRPPEYWPSPLFAALMIAADRLYVGDTFRYSRQSLQNRARLRNPNGWQWITIPLQSGQQGRAIAQTAINTNEPWIGRHWRALMFNYRSAPYFEYYEPRLRPIFEQEWASVGPLALATISFVIDALDLSVDLVPTSTLSTAPTSLQAVLAHDTAAPLLLAEDVVSHDASTATAAGRSCKVLQLDLPAYDQNFEGFEPNMSVVDLLFNYGPSTRLMLRNAWSVTTLSSSSATEAKS